MEEVCYLGEEIPNSHLLAGLVETSTDGMFLTHFIATPDGIRVEARES